MHLCDKTVVLEHCAVQDCQTQIEGKEEENNDHNNKQQDDAGCKNNAETLRKLRLDHTEIAKEKENREQHNKKTRRKRKQKNGTMRSKMMMRN